MKPTDRFTPGRCNYCNAASVVMFQYQSYLASSRPGRRWQKLTVRACAEHEGCVNWNSMRTLHPHRPLLRIARAS
jgi:hypothetical protein